MKIIYECGALLLILMSAVSCVASRPIQQEADQKDEIVAPAVQPEPPKAEDTEKSVTQSDRSAPQAAPEPPVKQETAPQAAPAKKDPVAVKKEKESTVETKKIEKKPEPAAEPEQKTEPQITAEPVSVPNNEVIARFDDVVITKETYDQTKAEIEKIVDQLNAITSSKQYAKWIELLSEEYKTEYSKPSVLKIVSEALPVKGIKLKSLQDYFLYVFVPSRQRIRVDDIRFISPTHVDVIMKQGSTSLLIYSISNVSGSWKLVAPKHK